jgi:hypothetical protein
MKYRLVISKTATILNKIENIKFYSCRYSSTSELHASADTLRLTVRADNNKQYLNTGITGREHDTFLHHLLFLKPSTYVVKLAKLCIIDYRMW